jgi:hypothetical protein
MPVTGGYEFIGIGALTVLLGFIWKIWQDHSKLSTRMTEVLERHAASEERLSSVLDGLKENVRENTTVTRETKDVFSAILVRLIQDNKKDR